MTNENKISQIKSDITEYENMQDRLHELRKNDVISQEEFHMLSVTINNRLHDFAQTLRDAYAPQIENEMFRWKREIESWLAERYEEDDEQYELFCEAWKRFQKEDVTKL